MELSPDSVTVFQIGVCRINLTVVGTWIAMALLVVSSWLISRKLVSTIRISRWQGFFEIVVLGIRDQIEEIGVREAKRYIGFLGSLFVFLMTANILSVIPGYRAPTSSLSTTVALALCVFLSVIVFGIREKGLKRYLKGYLEPVAIMLPFNLVSEISRTIALAVRLFGNMMSGELIVSMLLTITPFFFPAVMSVFGLLIGTVQAYIFTVLAAVYIAAATQLQTGE